MTKINIYASKDTFVCNDPTSKALNFGKQLNLIISPSHKSLLYFDLLSIPENATITSAKLQLYSYSVHPVSETSITIKQLKTNFYENVVTFDTSPASTPLLPLDTSTKNIKPEDINKVITFDNLTITVTSWYDNRSNNHGFELSTSTTSTLNFFTREYSNQNLQPTLEIEYDISNYISNDIPFIETALMTQMIYPSNNSFVETTIFYISKLLFFNYFIDNTISNTVTKQPPNFVFVSLKTCDTKNGTFENLGNEITISPNTTYSLEASPINKYVRLSIKGTQDTCLSVTGIYKTFTTMLPSRVKYAKIVGDTIILTMDRPLIGTTVDKNAFTIALASDIYDFPTVTVIETSILGNTVILVCSENAAFAYKIVTASLSYFATGTNNLTSINGDVLNFTNQPLSIATPYGILDQVGCPLLSTPLYSKPWDLSHYKKTIVAFKYALLRSYPIIETPVTIQLQGSNSIDGTFENIGTHLVFDESASSDSIFVFAVPLTTNYNYVRLSITADTPTTLFLLTAYFAYPNFIPSIVDYSTLSQDWTKIVLTMTKDLTVRDGDITAFTTSSPLPDLTITNVTISTRSLELTFSRALKFKDLQVFYEVLVLFIFYNKTETNNITGINGDVDNFNIIAQSFGVTIPVK